MLYSGHKMLAIKLFHYHGRVQCFPEINVFADILNAVQGCRYGINALMRLCFIWYC